MSPRQRRSRATSNRFGGPWTTQKLDVLAGYLSAYTMALKDKPTPERPFRKAYIDAFAGSGYRETDGPADNDDQQSLLPDLALPESQQLLEGSARIALRTDPPFDQYIFIERSRTRCTALERLKDKFPQLRDAIDIRQGDANEEIRALCAIDWRSRRAVLFLDPYGMQVEWTTIESIAATKAIDLWLLFPLGMGANRLMTRSGEIPEVWRHRLTALLGTDRWYQDLYSTEIEPDLFGSHERVVKASIDTIGRYFNERLRAVFAGVAGEPGVLRNSSNNPLYLLCFAVANERGKDVALRIANHLLKDLI